MKPLYLGNRKVGEYDDECFYTVRTPAHYMRKFQGFGISETILNFLEQKNIDKIILTYKGKKGIKTYQVRAKQFRDSDKEFVFNGEDKQKFLSEADMSHSIEKLNHYIY